MLIISFKLIRNWPWTVVFAGQLTLSPMSVAPVCRVGDPFQLTCTAAVEFMQWSILRVNEQGMLYRVTNDVILNSGNPNDMMQTRVDSIIFTFTRVSTQPFITTLSVESISIGLNGTVVRCSDAANQTISVSTTIHIIDSSQSELAYLGYSLLRYITGLVIYRHTSILCSSIKHFRRLLWD